MSSRRRVLSRAALLLLACSPCLWCGGCWAAESSSHGRFLRLLRGDPSVRVTALTGGPLPRPFAIDDPATLKYLSDALRAAEPDGYVPTRRGDSDRTGPTLHVEVWTGTVGPYRSSFEFPRDERVGGVTVFCELDDHYFFWVPLPRPVPAPLAAVVAEMREWERDRHPPR